MDLQWPVREAITVSAPTVQGISNFVDQDPDEANILDFNCGERTYDGHRGLDVFIAPFSWYKMERDEGIVIAAAERIGCRAIGIDHTKEVTTPQGRPMKLVKAGGDPVNELFI